MILVPNRSTRCRRRWWSLTRQLADVIAPHLDFSHLDAKGIFVVGNYGTGKSHLMVAGNARRA
jgi:chromosomal replication initiation ATPase DnaA